MFSVFTFLFLMMIKLFFGYSGGNKTCGNKTKSKDPLKNILHGCLIFVAWMNWKKETFGWREKERKTIFCSLDTIVRFCWHTGENLHLNCHLKTVRGKKKYKVSFIGEGEGEWEGLSLEKRRRKSRRKVSWKKITMILVERFLCCWIVK